MQSILFVCLGNICRSPLAEGIFRETVRNAGLDAQFHIDSAGTGSWHVGNPPDERSIEVAALNGVDISMQRSRQIRSDDFQKFDLILGMDRKNITTMRARAAQNLHPKIQLFLDTPPTDVPDPYYGGPDGFSLVYDMVHEGSLRLLEKLTR